MATFLLKKVPKPIKDYILDFQLEMKKLKGTQYSQEKTIIQIIKEHKEMKEFKKLSDAPIT